MLLPSFSPAAVYATHGNNFSNANLSCRAHRDLTGKGKRGLKGDLLGYPRSVFFRSALSALILLSSPLSRKRIDLYLSVSCKRDNANKKRGNIADITRIFQSVIRMLRFNAAFRYAILMPRKFMNMRLRENGKDHERKILKKIMMYVYMNINDERIE